MIAKPYTLSRRFQIPVRNLSQSEAFKKAEPSLTVHCTRLSQQTERTGALPKRRRLLLHRSLPGGGSVFSSGWLPFAFQPEPPEVLPSDAGTSPAQPTQPVGAQQLLAGPLRTLLPGRSTWHEHLVLRTSRYEHGGTACTSPNPLRGSYCDMLSVW